jgi:hypothetical protein
MTSRASVVSLERACELGQAMGMPPCRTPNAGFAVVANALSVARVAHFHVGAGMASE